MSLKRTRVHHGHGCAVVAALFLSLCSSAGAQIGPGQPILGASASRTTLMRGSSGPGLQSATPSAGTVDRALEQSTGLSSSDIRVENVCAAPKPGMASCASQALHLRSDGQFVHPRAHAQRALSTIRPAGVSAFGSPASAPATAPSQSQPTLGTPAYIQQAYDLTYLSQTKGATDTVAIVDAYDDPTAESDLANYRATYGLPACTTANGCFRKVNENGTSSPMPANDKGWEGEISLDLDAVSAVCPNCHILLVEASSAYNSDLDAAVATAAHLGANQVSNSWAGSNIAAEPDNYSGYGIPAVFATGDSGYNSSLYSGQHWDSYPASLPNVIAAGGTSLTPTTGGLGGRGYAEGAWPLVNGWGATSGCNLHVQKPTWQHDTGCTGRAYADVSADADPSTGLIVYDSGNGGWLQFGGTSLATPLIAAWYAITGITSPSPSWSYTNASLLNDPVGGNVGTCPSAYTYICNAGTGYDGPTGNGSISGVVAQGAPGIGGPTFATSSGHPNTYTQSTASASLTAKAGIYPNSQDTSYWVQYGTTTAYGQQTTPVDIGTGIAPVTVTPTVAGLASNTTYHYRLVAQNSLGTTYGYDSTALTLGPGAPVNTAAPVISGTPKQGQPLSTSNGTWNPSATSYSYQWQRDTGQGPQFIAGATAQTYTPQAADLGAMISVIVNASNSSGTASITAASVGPVLSSAPTNTTAPTVAGTAMQGATLTAGNGSWTNSPTSYAYQWQRSTNGGTTWSAISGATAGSYTPVAADIGAVVRASVTATNAYGTASAASAATATIASGAPFSTSAPVIAGAPHQGQVLTVSSTWNPAGSSYAYQWQRSSDNGTTWTSIGGATSSSYTLSLADENAVVRATVTATNPYGTASATSLAVGPVTPSPPVNTVAPVLSGSAQRTYTLTATQGTWSGPQIAYTYQWQHSTDGGQTWTNITGATATSYTLGVADEGTIVRMRVTATNIDGALSAVTNATVVVSPYPPANTVSPAIAGTAQRASTLTATQGTWTGPGLTYSYQWQQDFGEGYVDIDGQTAPTYTLTADDEGSVVRVLVFASNADATIVEASRPTTTVTAALPVNTIAPAISGTLQRASTLTATQGTWSGIASTYSYRWQRSSDGLTWTSIDGATSTSYSVTVADESNYLRFLVTATNADGASSAVSSQTAPVPSSPPANTVAPALGGTAQRASVLTASQGTWSGVGNAYTYQWQRSSDVGFTNIDGATSANYTLTTADEGSSVRVLLTASNPDGTLAVASAATATVQSAPPVNTALPTLTGAAQRAGVLTATQGTWTGVGNTYTLQWQRSTDGSTWTNISGATASTYTLGVSDENARLRVLVTASNPDATLAVPSAATTLIPSAPPAYTAVPTLTGAAQRGGVLTLSPGTWSGIGNGYAYKWQQSNDGGQSWSDIAGQTGTTYTLGVSDENTRLRAVVTASNPDGTLSASTAATSLIPSAPPVNTAVPTLTGTAQRASALSATQGSWNGIGNAYAYQWQRSANNGATWTNITGATTSTYTIAVADEAAQVRVTVIATNPDGAVSAPSAATATIPPAPPVSTAAPAVTGTPARDSTLTATQGTWSGIGNSYADQWQRSPDNGATWTSIAGATGATYTIAVADESAKLRVLVTATNPDGTLAVASPATATIPTAAPVNTAAPTISGTAQRASVLSATQGAWSGIGNTYAYQWQHDSGSGFTNIQGATAATYTIAVSDEYSKVRVLVTAQNPDATVSVASAPTTTIPSAPPLTTAAPTLSGTAQRTFVLTATQGSWSGIGNSYAYQWQRSTDGGATWTAIAAATAPTYTLALADVGAKIRALVTASNPDGTAGAPTAPTGAVQAGPPVNTVAPTISGTVQRGSILTATQGTWSGPDNVYTYQWQRSPDGGATWSDIRGETASAHTVGTVDENAILRVNVTASNADGTVAAASAATIRVPAAPPVSTAPPTITGTPQRAGVLSATPGTWSGIGNSYAFQWQRSPDRITWTNIAGATAATYTLGAADENAVVRATVIATNPDATVTAASAASATVQAAPPVITDLPRVTGTAQRTNVVSASTGTWSGPDNAYSVKWQRSADSGATWTDIAGATTSTYTLTTADENDVIRAFVTASNPDGTAGVGSPATSPVAPAPPVNTDRPVLSGSMRLGAVMSVATGNWTPPGATLAYRWQRSSDNGASWTDISGSGANAASYTLTQADVGQIDRALVIASNVDGQTTAASAATQAIARPPKNTTAPPAPTGTLQDASTLTAASGSWDTPGSTFEYGWVRCPGAATIVDQTCTAVGAGQTYTLQAADVGQRIAATVAATSAAGGTSTSVSSALTAVIQGRPLINTTAPSISGEPRIPNTLSANPGSWSVPVTSVSYVWHRCDADGTSNCTTVARGATQYTLGAGDSDHTIVLEADATSPGRTASAASAALTVQDEALPQPAVLPTISGSASRMSTLTAADGRWTNGASLTRQWQRCSSDGTACQDIDGATASTYVLTQSDEGHAISLQVTATNLTGSSRASAKPTAVVTPVFPVNTHRPVITGTAQQSARLSVDQTTWQTPDATTYASSWQRCAPDGSGCQTISGANGSTYAPTAADVGHALVAVVAATNVDGTVRASSDATGVVLPAAPRWKSLPTLSALNANVGTTITIGAGVWSGPAVSSRSTQLMRCTSACSPVGAANASSYAITTADLGAILRVLETASNDGGHTSVWSSSYVGPISSPDAGSSVLGASSVSILSGEGRPLATASFGAPVFQSQLASAGRRVVRTVKVRRISGIEGTLRAWACPVSPASTGAPQPCSKASKLRGAAAVTLALPAGTTGRVRVVVVRR